MKLQRRSYLIIFGVGAILLAIVILSIQGNWGSDDVPADETPTSVQAPPPTSPELELITVDDKFMTDSKEPRVLWSQDQQKLYVQNLHLIYTSDGASEQILYDWTEALPSQVWLNGTYLLIGTQLIEKDSQEEGHHGAWLAIQIEPTPVVVAEENNYFGPQEVLSVKLTEEPQLFFVSVLNVDQFKEEVFDPTRSEWSSINRQLRNDAPLQIPTKSAGLRNFSDTTLFNLAEGASVYSFVDEEGSIIYSQAPHYQWVRYVGYELIDAKLITFLEDSPRILGLLRNQAGEEIMSYIGYDLASWPADPRLWNDDWQALNSLTFTRRLPERLEVIQYKQDHSLEKLLPKYSQFQTTGGKWLSTQGSLVDYEVNGDIRSISYHDLINTEEANPEMIWASPLKDYIVKKEDRLPYEITSLSHHIPELSLEDDNTNAPFPRSSMKP